MPRLAFATCLALALGGPAPAALAQEEPPDGDDVGAPAPPPPVEDPEHPPPTVEADPDLRRAVRGSPVEEATVDPLLEAMHAFEREAFSPDAPTAEERPDPAAPPRSAAEARPDLPWLASLETGDIPVRWDPRVIRFLEFYRDDPRGRGIMSGWLKAQGRYRDMILAALRRNNLPEDLLYLAMIESSYNPLVVSRVGASGLWQFMPAAGRVYGLRRDHWVDERFDPELANEAQMLYFHDLHERFRNWHIALAAFNCGYGAVLKSLAKYGTNDFWALLDLEAGLPWESSVYVPKFLAAAIVGRNRAAFGYEHIVPEPPFVYDRVTVRKSVSLEVIARAAGVDVKAVKDLNPALRRGRTPPGVAEYVVRIPRGSKARFTEIFPQLEPEWGPTDTVVARHGERFEDIAKTYGLTPRELRDLNGIEHVTEVRGGTLLVVPRIDPEQRARNRAAAEEDLYHSDVVPGAPDEPLLVAVKDKDLFIDGKRRVFYRVVAGDTLDEIAAALGVRAGDLAAWNGLDPGTQLAARMVLVAFVPPRFDAAARNVALLDEARLLVVTTGSPEHLDIYEGRKGRVREIYTARSGDSLESIGKRFQLTKYDVARINRRGYLTPLEPGEKLVVYRVVDRAKAQKTGVFKNIKVAHARKAKVPTKLKGKAAAKPTPRKATAPKKAPARGKR
jgi:membrane-bound lytic murein transglycosylase D